MLIYYQSHLYIMLIHEPITSICISTWDRLEDLKKCINSISQQTYQFIEVVIVDNASTDGTYEYCQELIHDYQYPVLYKRMDNSDSSAMVTLNTAYNLATGQYILTLDDDARLMERDIIYNSVHYMKRNIQCFALSYRVIDVDGNDELDYTIMDDLTEVPEFFGAGFFARMDIFRQLNFFDESLGLYGNELDTSIRAYISKYHIIYLHNYTIFHNRHKSSLYTGYKSKYMLRNSLNAPMKYFDQYHRLIMVVGYGLGHIYYLLTRIHDIRVVGWWLYWYPLTFIKMLLPSASRKAPLWIQQYYCKRLYKMLRGK